MKKQVWVGALVFLALAYASYRITLWYIPHKLMQYTYQRWNPPNKWFHAGKETGARSWVPMGNPDFIISRCAYDLSSGPLLLTGLVPADTYWSLTLYQNNSTNFFITNDQGRAGQPYEYVLAKAGTAGDLLKSHRAEQIIHSPTERGYLVIRIFINPATDFAALKTAQEQAKVIPLKGRS